MASVVMTPSGETLAAIEDTFEDLRRFNETFIERSKTLLDDGQGGGDAMPGTSGVLRTYIAVKQRENLNDIVEGARTENTAVEKLALVFGYLKSEIRVLKDECATKALPFLLFFGEDASGIGDGGSPLPEGDAQLAFSKALPSLLDVLRIVERAKKLLTNLVRQCCAIHDDHAAANFALYKTFRSVQLKSVMGAVGTCLSILISVDSVIKHNPNLIQCLSMFQAVLEAASSDPAQYGTSPTELELLRVRVKRVDDLFSSQGNLQVAIEHMLCEVSMTPKSLKHLMRQMHQAMEEAFQHAAGRKERGAETWQESETLLQSLCLAIAYTWFSGDKVDKKTSKLIADVCKCYPMLPVFGHALLDTANVVERHFHPAWLKDGLEDVALHGQRNVDAFLTALDGHFGATCHAQMAALTKWCLQIDTDFLSGFDASDVFIDLLKAFKEGLESTSRLHGILSVFLHLHTHVGKPVGKAQIMLICHASAMLKMAEKTFHKRSVVLIQVLPYLLSTVQSRMYAILEPLKRKLESELQLGMKKSFRFLSAKDSEELKLDALAFVTIALHALDGPTSGQRISLLSFVFDYLHDSHELKGALSADLGVLFNLLETMFTFQDVFWDKCNCGFLLYSRKYVLSKYLGEVLTDVSSCHLLPYVLSAFQDGGRLVEGSGEEAVEAVERDQDAFVESVFHSDFIAPLGRIVENELRLHLLSERIEGMSKMNPLKDKVADLFAVLNLPPISIGGARVSIGDAVTHYLNQSFYNHTAIGLQNWKTYNEMICLAEKKYGLRLSEIHLPKQTLEQGLDVLDIMRDISHFVSSYSYNLHLQTFVERLAGSGERKHLNTISINHMANSIRVHGAGMINTTINYVYQYLTKKLGIVTTFLYDDHIRSRLKREVAFFHEHAKALDHCYPMDRASAFNKDIRKLGVTASGETYMDKFRQAVTEIGNALGFVRMVRLGLMRYRSQVNEFVPRPTQGVGRGGGEEKGEGEGAGEPGATFVAAVKADLADDAQAVGCAAALDAILENLQSKAEDSLDFLDILVSVFSKELGNDRFEHIRDFYVIVPAVSLNSVECLIRGKEKLSKRGADSEATFAEDGFALGLAFLLRVLGQSKAFDAMHWFDSVRAHYQAEANKLRRESAPSLRNVSVFGLGSHLSAEEAHNTQLLLSRVANIIKEFDLMEWTLGAARGLFARA